MPESMFDAIVIGAGSGGLTVAIGLAGFGKRVALVEADRVGGDCTNTGCIPSKRLLHLAHHPAPGGDPLAEVRATRDRVRESELEELAHTDAITLIQGRAELEAPGRVRVGERVLTAEHTIIATGSSPRLVDIPGLPGERALTSDTLFELDRVPSSMVIVGAGAIGLEMADAFNRLGTRVSVIDIAERALLPASADAAAALTDAMLERGIEFHFGVGAGGFDADSGRLFLGDGDDRRAIEHVDRVLIAVGRKPNTGHLGLARLGVEHTPHGITVDGWGRTSVRGVWAVGDVTPGSTQTHVANAMGRRIVQRIAFPRVPALGGPPLSPSAVFTSPEVAWVGLDEAELGRRCRPEAVTTITLPLPPTDRGLTDGLTHGFLSITAVRLTGRIVSATMVGPGASELIAMLTLAMNRRVSLLRLSRQVYAYPTHAGTIGRAADQFARETFADLGGSVRGYLTNRFRRPRGAAA